ncbi:hypothetical protein [Leptospira santarosai]|uniref:Uncharacterized protein n=1 Tax=Leptospira santarosai str. ZUN179 TaxID=1049985 RepID=M6UGX5_9LEPT|nr:hypothetical protein [Leptospira santarosai]EMO43805.1 hypothetical protein LEP1GSC187_0492 [Leptospira santarosai str. ZUN179]
MRREREITIDEFYAAIEEGEKRFADRANQKPVWTEERSPFSEDKYYEAASRRTGERCFASRICPSEGDRQASYQIIRYADHRKRWLSASEFVEDFRRFKEKPEPLRIDWIGSDYKKIAIDDNEDGTVLQAAFDRMRQRRREIA